MKNDHIETAQTLQPVELTPLSPLTSEIAAAPSLRMAALAGVKTQVQVIAGHVSTTIGDILNLKEGMVFKLDTGLNAPFDIVVNDTVIARGELVAVGDHFGVCVTHVQATGAR
jgi:flagellar motor switch protein FliN